MLFAASALPVCGAEENAAPAQKPAIQKLKIATGASDKAKTDEEAKADPYAVPDGTPAELVAYIKKLVTGPVPRDMDSFMKLRTAILKAAEKILASKPNEQEFEFAVNAKMNMLESPEQFDGFIKELKDGGHDKLARRVRGFELQTELRNRLLRGDTKVKDLVDKIVSYLEESPPQMSDRELAYTAGMAAETTGDNAWATKTCEKLVKIFAAGNDPKLADFTKVLEGVVRRLTLVGKEMTLEGTLLDGKPLDWSKYKGRIVLVLFWSTDYPPCMGELPSLQACYDAYHAKGFDILGISLDRERANLEDCLKARSIAWPNVFSEGKPNPAMIYYGVTNLPTMILVGKDGKVLSINVNGKGLKKTLEKLLGPAEAKTP